MIQITLPFPPSMNHYWRHVPMRYGKKTIVRSLISKRGRQFKEDCIEAVCRQRANESPFKERLMVDITLNPPTRHKRDIDNYVKATLDALTEAGVWVDDEQIDCLIVHRGEIMKGGQCIVAIGTVD